MATLMRMLLIVFFSAGCIFSHVYAKEDASFEENKPVILSDLLKSKRAMALKMARQFYKEDFYDYFKKELSYRGADSCDLVSLLKGFKARFRSEQIDGLYSYFSHMDSQMREAKGIKKHVAGLLEIRLAFSNIGLPEDSSDLLFAYVPDGDEKSWEYIEAFDIYGNEYQLDVNAPPGQQVIVVGLDSEKDMKAGITLMNEELKKAGIQSQISYRGKSLEVSKLDHIRVEDDCEPWISGASEIYALVNGISPGNSVNITAIDMPYLNYKDTDYYPNQVMIIWDNYRFNAANINFFEHDDNTNYKELVSLLIKSIGAVVPEYAYIFEIASQIILLMPDGFFTNDDDYVDVFYTLEKAIAYKNYSGVSNNIRFTLSPYIIEGE
ncbi:MAG: DUF3103 family protein [Desulfobacteraceae bacterium]|nr:DUF3103 family protein [Desulfobacteraceae bacterium]